MKKYLKNPWTWVTVVVVVAIIWYFGFEKKETNPAA